MKKILISIFLLLMMPLTSPAEDQSDFVRFKNNRLTVNVKNASIEKVLQSIARQAGIKIVCNGTFDRTISENFSDLPLDKGLKRLTRDLNCVMIYGPGKSDGDGHEVIEIVIIPDSPPGKSKTLQKPETARQDTRWKQPAISSEIRQPAAKEDQAAGIRTPSRSTLPELEEDEEALKFLTENIFKNEDESVKKKVKEVFESHDDASAKLKFVKTLEQIGGEKARSPLMEALKDEDEEVREAASSALQNLTKSPESQQ